MAATEPPSNTLPPLAPTLPLNSQFSRIYTHVHPVLVLGLFSASFSTIVANPVSTLHVLAYALAALQAVYCILCVPAARNTTSLSSAQSTATAKPRKAGLRSGGATLSSRIIVGSPHMCHSTGASLTPHQQSSILSFLLTFTLAVPLLTTLLVLHGAPLTTHHLPTLLLATHLSLLTTPPLFYTHGVSASSWRALVSLNVSSLDEVVSAAAGALLGAWVGAVPIPLDWDREWQKWPITVVAGAYAGWAVGKFVGRTVQSGILEGWGGGFGKGDLQEKKFEAAFGEKEE